MDAKKTGEKIRKMRMQQRLTQKELADMLCVSDKTVSKWERGCGMPDVSILPVLSETLHLNLTSLLNGESEENDMSNGNMKNLKFYVCPDCGNLIFAGEKADISCCGRKLTIQKAKKAEPEEKLQVEKIETEWYVTTDHEMTREHYISFVALLTGDTAIVRKLYPEWNMETRLPSLKHGMLLWYCTRHGVYYQQL